VKRERENVPEGTALVAPPSWHRCSHFSLLYSGPRPHSFTYSLALPPAARSRVSSASFLRHRHRPSFPFPSSYFPAPSLFHPSLMSVDTVIDLRQRAGDLAHRLGSLSHFMPAAQELLDIIHRLSSEILMRHNRKVGPGFVRFARRCSLIYPHL